MTERSLASKRMSATKVSPQDAGGSRHSLGEAQPEILWEKSFDEVAQGQEDPKRSLKAQLGDSSSSESEAYSDVESEDVLTYRASKRPPGVSIVARTKVLKGMPSRLQVFFVHEMKRVDYPAEANNEVICRAGDNSDKHNHFVVMDAGIVDVSVPLSNGTEVTIGRIGPGNVLCATLALGLSSTHLFTIRQSCTKEKEAKNESKEATPGPISLATYSVPALSLSEVEEEYDQELDLLRSRVLKDLRRFVVPHLMRFARAGFFRHYCEGFVREVVRNMDMHICRPGELIFREHTPGQSMAILFCGSIDIFSAGQRVASLDTPGTIIGESSLTEEQGLRGATVRCNTQADCIICLLQKRDFLKTLEKFPEEQMRLQEQLRLKQTRNSIQSILVDCEDNFLHFLAAITESVVLEAGTCIYGDGRHNEELLMLLRGDAFVMKPGEANKPLQKGSCAGFKAAIGLREGPPDYTICAGERGCKLIQITRKILQQAFVFFPGQVAPLLKAVGWADLTVLPDTHPFKEIEKRGELWQIVTRLLCQAFMSLEFDDSMSRLLSPFFKCEIVDPGCIITEEKKESNEMVLLLHGSVRVSTSVGDISEVQEAPGHFNEGIVVGCQKRQTATIVAQTTCVLWTLAVEQVPEMKTKCFCLYRIFEQCAKSRRGFEMSLQARLQNTKTFRRFRGDILQLICAGAETLTFLPGETIFAVEDIGNCIYTVLRGNATAEQTVNGQVSTSELDEGSTFGEMVLLGQGKRTMTVVADKLCICSVVHKDVVNTAFGNGPNDHQDHHLKFRKSKMEVLAEQKEHRDSKFGSLLKKASNKYTEHQHHLGLSCMQGSGSMTNPLGESRRSRASLASGTRSPRSGNRDSIANFPLASRASKGTGKGARMSLANKGSTLMEGVDRSSDSEESDDGGQAEAGKHRSGMHRGSTRVSRLTGGNFRGGSQVSAHARGSASSLLVSGQYRLSVGSTPMVGVYNSLGRDPSAQSLVNQESSSAASDDNMNSPIGGLLSDEEEPSPRPSELGRRFNNRSCLFKTAVPELPAVNAELYCAPKTAEEKLYRAFSKVLPCGKATISASVHGVPGAGRKSANSSQELSRETVTSITGNVRSHRVWPTYTNPLPPLQQQVRQAPDVKEDANWARHKEAEHQVSIAAQLQMLAWSCLRIHSKPSKPFELVASEEKEPPQPLEYTQPVRAPADVGYSTWSCGDMDGVVSPSKPSAPQYSPQKRKQKTWMSTYMVPKKPSFLRKGPRRPGPLPVSLSKDVSLAETAPAALLAQRGDLDGQPSAIDMEEGMVQSKVIATDPEQDAPASDARGSILTHERDRSARNQRKKGAPDCSSVQSGGNRFSTVSVGSTATLGGINRLFKEGLVRQSLRGNSDELGHLQQQSEVDIEEAYDVLKRKSITKKSSITTGRSSMSTGPNPMLQHPSAERATLSQIPEVDTLLALIRPDIEKNVARTITQCALDSGCEHVLAKSSRQAAKSLSSKVLISLYSAASIKKLQAAHIDPEATAPPAVQKSVEADVEATVALTAAPAVDEAVVPVLAHAAPDKDRLGRSKSVQEEEEDLAHLLSAATAFVATVVTRVAQRLESTKQARPQDANADIERSGGLGPLVDGPVVADCCRCVCGDLFMPGAMFCAMCGAKRPLDEDDDIMQGDDELGWPASWGDPLEGCVSQIPDTARPVRRLQDLAPDLPDDDLAAAESERPNTRKKSVSSCVEPLWPQEMETVAEEPSRKSSKGKGRRVRVTDPHEERVMVIAAAFYACRSAYDRAGGGK